jgi:hypothetical protein
MSARKWFLVVNSHLRMAVGHPFLAVGGLKEAHRAIHRPGARHTIQPGRPPSSGTWEALLFPSGRLTGAHKQSVPRSGGKIVLVRWIQMIFRIQMYHKEIQVKFEYGCNPIIIEKVIALGLRKFLENEFPFIFSLMV